MLLKKICGCAFIICSYEFLLQKYIQYWSLQLESVKRQMSSYQYENEQSIKIFDKPIPKLGYYYGKNISNEEAASICNQVNQKINTAKKYSMMRYLHE